ncbi:MAG: PucR family transcriptional regulator, partial [Clostridia bacterium]|nr:PucR family transcriptional regulator [Clostridia bacterium]
MSNRLFQGVIHQMRDAIDRTVGVIDESGTVISCSELERIGEQNKALITDIFNSNDPIILDGTTYLSFDSRLRHEYAIFVDGEDELAEKYARILSVSFGSIKQFYDEKYDRSN